MTAIIDSKAITHTATAKVASSKSGADIAALQAHLTLKLSEAKTLVAQIIALTPSGDANLTALNTLLAELA